MHDSYSLIELTPNSTDYTMTKYRCIVSTSLSLMFVHSSVRNKVKARSCLLKLTPEFLFEVNIVGEMQKITDELGRPRFLLDFNHCALDSDSHSQLLGPCLSLRLGKKWMRVSEWVP